MPPKPRRPRRPRRPRSVREPLQVYLDRDDRALLDRLAEDHGVPRAEILRRGLRNYATARPAARSPVLEFLCSIRGSDWPADMVDRLDDYLAMAYGDMHAGGGGRRRRR